MKKKLTGKSDKKRIFAILAGIKSQDIGEFISISDEFERTTGINIFNKKNLLQKFSHLKILKSNSLRSDIRSFKSNLKKINELCKSNYLMKDKLPRPMNFIISDMLLNTISANVEFEDFIKDFAQSKEKSIPKNIKDILFDIMYFILTDKNDYTHQDLRSLKNFDNISKYLAKTLEFYGKKITFTSLREQLKKTRDQYVELIIDLKSDKAQLSKGINSKSKRLIDITIDIHPLSIHFGVEDNEITIQNYYRTNLTFIKIDSIDGCLLDACPIKSIVLNGKSPITSFKFLDDIAQNLSSTNEFEIIYDNRKFKILCDEYGIEDKYYQVKSIQKNLASALENKHKKNIEKNNSFSNIAYAFLQKKSKVLM